MAEKIALDNELEIILNVLIRKGTETSAFLSLPANEALKAMCQYCTEGRIVSALLGVMSGHNKSAPQQKIRLINCIELLLKRIQNRLTTLKEGEKLLLMLAACLSEGSLEVRNAAKSALSIASREVNSSIDFDRLLQRALHEHLYSKVKEVLSKEIPEIPINEKFLIMNSNTKKAASQQSPSSQRILININDSTCAFFQTFKNWNERSFKGRPYPKREKNIKEYCRKKYFWERNTAGNIRNRNAKSKSKSKSKE